MRAEVMVRKVRRDCRRRGGEEKERNKHVHDEES